jgi:transcriptional regulator with PAS, ATPase and Fis domain
MSTSIQSFQPKEPLTTSSKSRSLVNPIEQLEHRLIEECSESVRRNKQKVAQMLSLSR